MMLHQVFGFATRISRGLQSVLRSFVVRFGPFPVRESHSSDHDGSPRSTGSLATSAKLPRRHPRLLSGQDVESTCSVSTDEHVYKQVHKQPASRSLFVKGLGKHAFITTDVTVA